MDVKPILGAGIGLQSTALMAQNLKLLKMKKGKIKAPKIKKIVKVGVGNMVGISLIDAQASMINKL